ncbi:hypothetical protein [Stenotrophomonas sp.]|uniref:hypothetical protein n=1 Tax=Stenotrophomonas sp. TaxID=69392 RepID=UPI0028AC450F|nr:hypothetical protein [Stenotrophomonas sp.]
MATAGSIVIDLLMRTGSFVTDADRAEKAVKKLEKTALAMGAALGAGLATAATTLTALVKSSIDTMDEMSKTAKVVNMGTEDFSKLAYAASFADLTVQDLQTTIGRLTKAQTEALDSGSKQAQIFDALGISIKDSNGKLRPTIDLLYDFADAFKAQKGSQEVVTAGMAIFGKSFQGLIDLLKDGSQGLRDAGVEAQAFGQVISGEAGSNAEEFNDNLAKMKLWVQGVGNAVAADLLPDLLQMSGQFLDSAKSGEKLNETASRIADGLRVIATAAGYVAKAFDLAGTAIAASLATANAGVLALQGDFKRAFEMFAMGQDGLIAKVKAFGDDGSSAPSAPKVNLIDPSEGLIDWKAQKEMESRLQKLFDGSGEGKGGGKSAAQSDAEKLTSAYKQLNEQLAEQIALHGDNSAAAKLEYDLTVGGLKGLTDAQKEELRQKQDKLDLMDLQAEADRAALDLFKKEQEAEEDRKKAFKDHKEDLEFELSLLTLSNKERAKAIELRYAGVDAASAEGKAIGELSGKLYDQTQTTDKLISLQDDLRDAFADNFYDVITGAKSAKDAVKDFFDSVADSILKMITQNLTSALFGQQGQNGGGMFGGAISSMFSGMFGGGGAGGAAAGGGGFWSGVASMFGGGKAIGGDVLSGRGYWVGEEGPEWFAPRGTGTIVPTAVAMNQGRGGKQIVQNLSVTVAGRPDGRTPQQIARESGKEAARAMSRTGR